MLVCDASGLIHGWDNYPVDIFPRLWEWVREEVTAGRFAVPRCAMEEIDHKSPDCGAWLTGANAAIVQPENAILQRALQIKQALGIQGDNYHVDGVDENDILIISTACIHRSRLLSNESRQPMLPLRLDRYKIPAVCNLPDAGINCMNFLELIKEAGRAF